MSAGRRFDACPQPCVRCRALRILTAARLLTAVGGGGMRGLLWLVAPVALAALMAGCSSDKARPRTGPSPSASPSSSSQASESAAEKAIARVKAAKVAAFVDRAEPIDRGGVRPGFSLDEVQYTSPIDSVATYGNCGKTYKRVCTTVIATTHESGSRYTSRNPEPRSGQRAHRLLLQRQLLRRTRSGRRSGRRDRAADVDAGEVFALPGSPGVSLGARPRPPRRGAERQRGPEQER